MKNRVFEISLNKINSVFLIRAPYKVYVPKIDLCEV